MTRHRVRRTLLVLPVAMVTGTRQARCLNLRRREVVLNNMSQVCFSCTSGGLTPLFVESDGRGGEWFDSRFVTPSGDKGCVRERIINNHRQRPGYFFIQKFNCSICHSLGVLVQLFPVLICRFHPRVVGCFPPLSLFVTAP